MKPGTALVTFHGDWAVVDLDREVVPYSTRPITDKGLCVCKASSWD